MAYAPNASIIVSADNLEIANGAVLKLITTNATRLDVFANRVTITGKVMDDIFLAYALAASSQLLR